MSLILMYLQVGAITANVTIAGSAQVSMKIRVA